VTGGAGFIGSHLVEFLLSKDQEVVCLDDFSTGNEQNLDFVRAAVGAEAWTRFTLIRGDIREETTCHQACDGVDFVLHHAAMGSVPQSLREPLTAAEINYRGTLNLLEAATESKIQRFVYASTSAIYGDETTQPACEQLIGRPLSQYASSKWTNEQMATAHSAVRDLKTIGLRYFNVVGPRQDPSGPYAAVIPIWIRQLLNQEPVVIHGDGSTTRDFCPVANVVSANMAAALHAMGAPSAVANIALGKATNLKDLFLMLRAGLADRGIDCVAVEPTHGPFRDGDILHSVANIDHAKECLGWEPHETLDEGLARTLDAYVEAQ